MNRLIFFVALAAPLAALGHDSWLQTNVGLVRAGDVVQVDLMLGNHGNEHRDFKLAGKVPLEGSSLAVIDPDGKRYDVVDRLIDTGYAPQEGFGTTRFEPTKPGLYTVAHRTDRVMSYAPERAINVVRQPRLRPGPRA